MSRSPNQWSAHCTLSSVWFQDRVCMCLSASVPQCLGIRLWRTLRPFAYSLSFSFSHSKLCTCRRRQCRIGLRVVSRAAVPCALLSSLSLSLSVFLSSSFIGPTACTVQTVPFLCSFIHHFDRCCLTLTLLPLPPKDTWIWQMHIRSFIHSFTTANVSRSLSSGYTEPLNLIVDVDCSNCWHTNSNSARSIWPIY